MVRPTIRNAALLAFLVASCQSCATSTAPPRLSPQDEELLATARFPFTVGAERFEYPAYSERFVTSLRATGLFEEVRPLEEVEDPDLIASVRRPIYGTASIAPLLTIVTLGVVPTIVDEEWGESFTLRGAGPGDAEVDIEFAYSGPTTLGWLALLRAMSPRHALGRPHEKPRFQRALAVAIAERGVEIEELAGQ